MINNSESYSEPSLTSTMELLKIFNDEKLLFFFFLGGGYTTHLFYFWGGGGGWGGGVHYTLVLIKSHTKITIASEMSLLQNLLNLIFEK